LAQHIALPVQMELPRVEESVISEYPLKPPPTGSMPLGRSNSSRPTTRHSKRTSIFGRWQDWLSGEGQGSQNLSGPEAKYGPTASEELNAESRLRNLLRRAGSERITKGKSVDRGF
jgi:hypothetical protein